jgi:K+-sensing histidine kinase KdpD
MTREKRIVEILLAINNISKDDKLPFEEKLHRILLEIADCLKAKRGSIMLLKGPKTLEVAASTHPQLVGLKQSLDEKSASAWVVKNKVPLYVDKDTENQAFRTRSTNYEKTAFLLAPIVRNNRVIGVLSITDKMGEDVFDKQEREMLLDVSGQVITALENERLAQSLRKSRKMLQKKNHELERLEKLRTDLFNMLIHDLKGPLSEVVANLDILSYTLEGDNRQFVESAQIGCDTLQAMVGNLLDVARFEEHKLKLIYEKIDPGDLVTEALGRLARAGKAKEVELVEKFPSCESKAGITGDRGILVRVFQNLLSNAIRYSPAGETIDVGFAYLNPGKVEFFVRDRGPGVPAECRELIFEKFRQLDKKTDGRVYTSGLGLAFCKMAVQAHKGKIGVRPGAPTGSDFWFSIPLNVK